jgi:quinol monooxygenase YgiN
MIFITAKFAIKAEHAETWPDIAADFTDATRNESGCLWFEWSRSVDSPSEYVLIEAFRDADAAGEHVNSAHFKQAQSDFPQHLVETPKIVNFEVPQDDWSRLGEMEVPASG